MGDQLMGWIRSRNGSSRGQTIVEFAVIAPLFFLLLFGIIDFGMAMDHRITLQHAVREGARYAAVHDGCLDIQNRTAERAGTLIDPGEVSVSYEDNPAPDGSTVTVSAPFHYDFPIMSYLGIGSIDADVSGAAMLENDVLDAEGCGP